MILLTHHRLHPNLEGIINGCRDFRIPLKILIPRTQSFESLSSADGGEEVVLESDDLNLLSARKLLIELSPKLVIIRHQTNGFKNLYVGSRLMGIRVIGYDQSVLYSDSLLKQCFRPLRRFFSIGPFRTWTPIQFTYSKGARWRDQSAFYAPLPITKGTRKTSFSKSVLVVGKLGEHRKNIEPLIRALRHTSWSVQIIGSKPHIGSSDWRLYERIVSMARETENIVVKEDLNRIQVRKIMREATFLVHPAHSESLGYTVMEGLSNGCIVVCNNDVGASTYIKHGTNGFIYDQKSEDIHEILNEIVTKYDLGTVSLRAYDTFNNRQFEQWLSKIGYVY